jgi:hypothetical protein
MRRPWYVVARQNLLNKQLGLATAGFNKGAIRNGAKPALVALAQTVV